MRRIAMFLAILGSGALIAVIYMLGTVALLAMLPAEEMARRTESLAVASS